MRGTKGGGRHEGSTVIDNVIMKLIILKIEKLIKQ